MNDDLGTFAGVSDAGLGFHVKVDLRACILSAVDDLTRDASHINHTLFPHPLVVVRIPRRLERTVVVIFLRIALKELLP